MLSDGTVTLRGRASTTTAMVTEPPARQAPGLANSRMASTERLPAPIRGLNSVIAASIDSSGARTGAT